jgi:GNAT superfamily N-acetyltransferase
VAASRGEAGPGGGEPLDGATIGPPDKVERRALVAVLARAFQDNPMNLAIHAGSRRRRIRANGAGLRALVLDSGEATEKRVMRMAGRIVGGWIATRPGLFPLPAPSVSRQIGCLFHQGVRAMDQWGRASRELEELHPQEAHWYLAVLGVEPALHGQGLGAALLAELHQLVAERPAPIYLECDDPRSVGFYQSQGYSERSVREVNGVRCVCLGRGFADAAPDLCDPVRVGRPQP